SLFAWAAEFSKQRLGKRMAKAVTKATALGKHVSCFQLGRRFSHVRRWEKQPGDWAAVKLRPESEMDNFSCSHRCTLTVRLWLGARPCYRTGASRSVSCLSYFLLLLPWPSRKCCFL